jgi:hypothetical protein
MSQAQKRKSVPEVASEVKEDLKAIVALLAKRDHASKKEGLRMLIALGKDAAKSAVVHKIGFSSLTVTDATDVFDVDAGHLAHKMLSAQEFRQKEVADVAKGTKAEIGCRQRE